MSLRSSALKSVTFLFGFLAIATLVASLAMFLWAMRSGRVASAVASLAVASERGPTTTGLRAATSLIAAVTILVVIAVGAVDGLVWDPLAMAPAYSVDEIFTQLFESARLWGSWAVLAWAALWAIVVTALIVVAALLIVSTVIFFQWFASFSLANSISDTVPPLRGTQSIAGRFHRVAGQAALVAGIVVALAPVSRGGSSTARRAPHPAALR